MASKLTVTTSHGLVGVLAVALEGSDDFETISCGRQLSEMAPATLH